MMTYDRKCVYSQLIDFTHAKPSEFIEIVEWYNTEGIDVLIATESQPQKFSISYDELKAINKLIKKLNK
jgi:hypothetical protein